MALYETLSGKAYRLENEATPIDVDSMVIRPFPYCTNSSQVIGTQLISIGSLLHRLQVPPGGRVLEFGPGWGNTTLALAMGGYCVTAVDISESFCELIRRRAEHAGVTINVVHSDFMWAESVTEPYDAVVFFECFHHCDDHLRLLRALHRAVKPGGRVYFGGEPITDGFPVPWGLRLDGESLWAIRKHGWLELGFTESYFVKALESTGWAVTKHASSEHFAANIWEAVRMERNDIQQFDLERSMLSSELNTLRNELQRERNQVEEQKSELESKAALIEAFKGSSSWKLTAPIRAVTNIFRKILR